MSTVWILESGEDPESGSIDGVYGSRNAAYADFAMRDASLHRRPPGHGTIDRALQREDGSLYLYVGCAWVSLTPHEVVTVPQLPSGLCDEDDEGNCGCCGCGR